jgi:hypothetical protein
MLFSYFVWFWSFHSRRRRPPFQPVSGQICGAGGAARSAENIRRGRQIFIFPMLDRPVELC